MWALLRPVPAGKFYSRDKQPFVKTQDRLKTAISHYISFSALKIHTCHNCLNTIPFNQTQSNASIFALEKRKWHCIAGWALAWVICGGWASVCEKRFEWNKKTIIFVLLCCLRAVVMLSLEFRVLVLRYQLENQKKPPSTPAGVKVDGDLGHALGWTILESSVTMMNHDRTSWEFQWQKCFRQYVPSFFSHRFCKISHWKAETASLWLHSSHLDPSTSISTRDARTQMLPIRGLWNSRGNSSFNQLNLCFLLQLCGAWKTLNFNRFTFLQGFFTFTEHCRVAMSCCFSKPERVQKLQKLQWPWITEVFNDFLRNHEGWHGGRHQSVAALVYAQSKWKLECHHWKILWPETCQNQVTGIWYGKHGSAQQHLIPSLHSQDLNDKTHDEKHCHGGRKVATHLNRKKYTHRIQILIGTPKELEVIMVELCGNRLLTTINGKLPCSNGCLGILKGTFGDDLIRRGKAFTYEIQNM